MAEGKQPADAAPAAGAGGPPPLADGRSRRRGRARQQDVAKLLRELMGLPPAAAPRRAGAHAATEPEQRNRTVKKVLLAASALTLATRSLPSRRRRRGAAGRAAAGRTAARRAVAPKRADAAPRAGGDGRRTADFQPMVTRYCVGCHNTRNRFPPARRSRSTRPTSPIRAPTRRSGNASCKKLGVGAMPPQGSPTPGAAELTRFRSTLVASLDAAAAKKNNPGSYVLHRLNRTEYANAVRDLLGVTIDVTELLPSDGGDFGFDNIATALKTSPLLLERYLTAGLRVAELAVGDAGAEPGTATYTISTVVTQKQHVEGLPLGTRGGIVVPHTFPADGEYVFSGRLLKTVAEGLVGRRRARDAAPVHRHHRRQAGVLGADRRQGGPRRGEENTPVPREEFDKRMTSPRIKVTAGLHDVGFTFIERPQQEQNVWQPVLRDSAGSAQPVRACRGCATGSSRARTT